MSRAADPGCRLAVRTVRFPAQRKSSEMLRIAATEQLSKSFPERQDLRAFFDAGYVPSPVFISIYFPIKGTCKSVKCRRSSALDLTSRTLPRFRCRFDSDRPLQILKDLRRCQRFAYFPRHPEMVLFRHDLVALFSNSGPRETNKCHSCIDLRFLLNVGILRY